MERARSTFGFDRDRGANEGDWNEEGNFAVDFVTFSLVVALPSARTHIFSKEKTKI